jgi:hypothetical protein
MSNSFGPLYECTYVVSAEVNDEFASWLRAFQERAFQEPGIEDARGYEPEPDTNGYFGVIFRYSASDEHVLFFLHFHAFFFLILML